nr:hypothetical protein [uncultured Flavobacterium sp.]
MKKLTQVQIEQLFAFTKKHYVEFYDVQVELVDHLANAIEAEWEVNPNLSFDEALQAEFKKFGIFGFTGLVEQKQNELHKYYNKMLWDQLKQFVSIPKIIITIALYLLVVFILNKTGYLGVIIITSILVLTFLVFMIDGLRYMYKIKKVQKKQSKSWLIQSVASNVFSIPTSSISGTYFYFVARFFSNESGLSILGVHLFAAIAVFQIICIFIFYDVIKPSLNKSIQETEKRYQTI